MTGPDDAALARAVREAVARFGVAWTAWEGSKDTDPAWHDVCVEVQHSVQRVGLATCHALRAGLEVVVERPVGPSKEEDNA